MGMFGCRLRCHNPPKLQLPQVSRSFWPTHVRRAVAGSPNMPCMFGGAFIVCLIHYIVLLFPLTLLPHNISFVVLLG
jgi:hypothetical protein